MNLRERKNTGYHLSWGVPGFQPRWHHVAPSFLALLLFAIPSQAFWVAGFPNFLGDGPHQEITVAALGEIAYPLGGDTLRFSDTAKDTVARQNALRDEEQSPVYHCDNERIKSCNQYILAEKNTVTRLLTTHYNPLVAETGGVQKNVWHHLGFGLHTLQDFYAHSTWVHGDDGVHPDMAVREFNYDRPGTVCDETSTVPLPGKGLTSGYYLKGPHEWEELCTTDLMDLGFCATPGLTFTATAPLSLNASFGNRFKKCIHGHPLNGTGLNNTQLRAYAPAPPFGAILGTGQEGIAKDSVFRELGEGLHTKATNIATTASTEYVQQIIDSISDYYEQLPETDFKRVNEYCAVAELTDNKAQFAPSAPSVDSPQTLVLDQPETTVSMRLAGEHVRRWSAQKTQLDYGHVSVDPDTGELAYTLTNEAGRGESETVTILASNCLGQAGVTVDIDLPLTSNLGGYTYCLVVNDACWGLNIQNAPEEGTRLITWAAHQNLQGRPVVMADDATAFAAAGEQLIQEGLSTYCEDGTLRPTQLSWATAMEGDLAAGTMTITETYTYLDGCWPVNRTSLDYYRKD